MTMINMNTPNNKKQFDANLWLENSKPLDKKQIRAIKMQLHLMYIGFTYSNWAKSGTKLGTAKQMALTQIESFIHTFEQNGKTNAVVAEMKRQFDALKKKAAESIMKNPKSSESLMPPKLASKYKQHGQNLADASMKKLREFVEADKTKVVENEKQVESAQQQITKPQMLSLSQIMLIRLQQRQAA